MRAANDMPGTHRTPGRGRVLLIVVVVGLFVVVTSIKGVAEFWTGYLWFDSVGLQSVWTRTLGAKIGLATAFSFVLFALLWVNLLIADRIAPVFRPLGPDEDLLNRYHQIVDRRAGTLRLVLAAVLGVTTGVQMASQWDQWLLFANAADFNQQDLQFQQDIGYYVFRLPFLSATVSWLFTALVIVFLVTTVAHYFNGGIRVQSPLERVTPQVKAHLSVLLALLALVKAVDYYLQRYEILFSSRGAVDGASYTEVNASLPATHLLLFIALAAFVLFLVNIRRRGWVLPAVAVGLWLFVQLIVGQAYPLVFQRFVVTPEESAKEQTAIQRNITATRAAYGLDNVKERDFDYNDDREEAARVIQANPSITRNVPLLDTERVLETFKKKQSAQAPLVFNRVATDRYKVKTADGKEELTQVVISNREMAASDIPSKSWQGERLNYTHGYGFALAAANAVDRDGAPRFSVSGIPVATTEDIDVPPLKRADNYYFVQPPSNTMTTLPEYSIVNTASPEFDYDAQEGPPATYDTAAGGVQLDSFLKRLAFALRFNDFNLLISQYIRDDSRVLFMRDVRQRAYAVAPFLSFDSDPYPAVVDGEMVYILDAYTTTDRYPNAQRYPNQPLDLPVLRYGTFNYVRNSVKVVVNTYTGALKFYVADPNDPIIRSYQQAYPDLFSSKHEMSKNLLEHVRYPGDLFTVQTDMWGRYHIGDPGRFYNRDGAWEPPPKPTESPGQAPAGAPGSPAPTTTLPPGVSFDDRSKIKLDRMAPSYVLNKLPNDAKANFMLMRTFQPFSEDERKQQLASFMVARCDGEDLNQLEVFKMPQEIQGPAYVVNQMSTDEDVSRAVSLLDTRGSAVFLSRLIVLPIGRTIVYVRSMYVVSDNTPLVQYVILSTGSEVFLRPTLREALREAFPRSDPQTLEADRSAPGGTTPGTSGAGTTTTTGGGPAPGPTTTAPGGAGNVQTLIAEADQLFNEADQAQKDGNTVLWATKIKAAQERVRQAQELILGAAASPTTTTTTTTTTAPSGAPPAPAAAPGATAEPATTAVPTAVPARAASG